MYPRILFFINGVSPSLDEQVAADQLAPCRVSFRNANFVPKTGALEACDGVFGEATPERYKKAYKPAQEAIKAFVEKRAAKHKLKAQAAEQAKQNAADRVAGEAKTSLKDAIEKEDAARAAKENAAKVAKEKAEKANKLKEANKAKEVSKEDIEKAAAAWTSNGDAN